MKNRISFIVLTISLLLTSGVVLAQNKVVVVPLDTSGPQVAGSNGQIQYNNNGNIGGAQVYYDKSTGNVGIGDANPSEALDVNGSVSAVDYYGDGSNLTGVVTSESDPTVASSVKDGVDWSELTGIPSGFSDGTDDGLTGESDPTVAASVKDGVDWSELTGIPAGFSDDTDDGLTSESDPTVAASVKDGVDWSELSGIPSGFSDGTDDGGKRIAFIVWNGPNSGSTCADCYGVKMESSGTVLAVQTWCSSGGGNDWWGDIEKNGTSVLSTRPQYLTTTIGSGVVKSDGTEDFVQDDVFTFSLVEDSNSDNPIYNSLTLIVEYD